MKITNMYQAKTHLSSLVDDALDGKEVVIARSGKPLVRLVPYTPTMKSRKPGLLKGKITVPSNFDETSEEILDLFRGDDNLSWKNI